MSDPRTGEIIKGVVELGSLRDRQDYLIAEGILSPYKTGDEPAPELRNWALSRIKQLAAHEVGHTLGLGHNYYDSTMGRISVLDYPHPLVTLNPVSQLANAAFIAFWSAYMQEELIAFAGLFIVSALGLFRVNVALLEEFSHKSVTL